MRAALSVVLVWAALAAPASAATDLRFDSIPVGTTMGALGLPGVTVTANKRGVPATACGGVIVADSETGGHSLRIECPVPTDPPDVTLTFASRVTWVGVRVDAAHVPVTLGPHSSSSVVLTGGTNSSATPDPPRLGVWSPPVTGSSQFGALIESAGFGSLPLGALLVRSIAFSPVIEPQLSVNSTAPGQVAFSASSPGPLFRCSLDGGAEIACTSPWDTGAAGLTPGAHSATVRLVGDDYNGVASGQALWIVEPPRSPFSPVAPPRAGVDATLTVLSGTVLVTVGGIPTPLTGSANVALGTTIDARKGVLRVATSGNRSAQLAAAIFAIKQKGNGTPDIAIATPAGASRACAKVSKGVVRQLKATIKGRQRVIAAAATITSAGATYTVADTCTGTRVKVTKGTASVFDKGRKRTITVRKGKTYTAKARLFGAKKHLRHVY
jgi:hypothetical protein